MTRRLAVLVSGSGTNMAAIAEACADGRLDASIVSVVTNRPDAGAIERAAHHDLPVEIVPVDGRTRATYDGVLAHVLGSHEPDLVVLAGWMRILGSSFLKRFRVINLHPALPGAHPGLDAIERSFAECEAGTIGHGGVMVHWVPDEGVDDGPVILTEPVPYEPGETLDAFEARVHAVEHRVLVEAIRLALNQTEPAITASDDPHSERTKPEDPPSKDTVNA